MKKAKLFTKDFIATSVVTFVLMLSMYLLLVIMTSYSIEKYEASTSLAGLVSSVFIIGSLVGRLFAGRFITQIGTYKMLLAGLIIVVITLMFYFIPTNIYVLMLIRLIHGVGLGLATTATGTIVSQILPPSRSGEGIGYFSLSTVLATAIGPLIGIALLGKFGYTSIFVFSFVVGVISLVLACFIKAPVIVAKVHQKGFRFSDYFEKRALPISIVMFYAAFAYSGILSFITAYANEIHLVKAGSFYFLVYALAILVSRPFTGRLLDSRGGNSIIYPGLILFAGGLLLLSHTTTTGLFLCAAVIIGLGYGNLQSTTQAIAVKLTPKERMGLANSTYFIFLDLGLGFGPFALGYLVPTYGYRGVYFALAIFSLIGLVLYFFLHGRKEKELLFPNESN